MNMTMPSGLLLGAGVGTCGDRSAARWPARRAIRRKTDHRDHSVRRRQRQRRGQPHHARQDVEERWASRSSSRTGPAPAATRAPALRRKAAPDGYTLVGGGSGPVAANLSLYKSLGYDPEKDLEMISPFAGFTIVVVASKNAADQVAQGTDRVRQGQSRQAQLRLGRHRQLAASGRRIFRAGHRRQAHPRALSQHRAIRPRPDRRPGAARLPVVPERRRPARRRGRDPACGRRRQAPRGAAGHADHHRSRYAGIQGRGWFALLAPAGTPKPILERLNKEMKAALERPAGEEGLRDRRRRDDVDAARSESKKFHARRDRQVSRHHHQGRHRRRSSRTGVA